MRRPTPDAAREPSLDAPAGAIWWLTWPSAEEEARAEARRARVAG